MGQPRRFFQSAQPGERQTDRLLTTEQVREKFGLGSVNAVYRLVAQERLPRVRIGQRLYRYSERDLDRWLEQRSPRSTAARLVNER
jgi:excisionase family DNA binding protein